MGNMRTSCEDEQPVPSGLAQGGNTPCIHVYKFVRFIDILKYFITKLSVSIISLESKSAAVLAI